MGRIETIEETLKNLEKRLEQKGDFPTEELKPKEEEKPEEKKWKFPFKTNTLFKRSAKKTDYVLVQYLTNNYQCEYKLLPVISGNIVMVRNKAYELDPRKIYRYGKVGMYIIREFDRKPVSNEDYKIVKELKQDTDSDVPLIKAVLGAIMKEQKTETRNWMILIIIGVIVLGAAYMFFGK